MLLLLLAFCQVPAAEIVSAVLVSLLLLDVSVVSCVVVSPDIAVCLTAVVVSLRSLLARVSSVDAFVSSATVVFNVSAVVEVFTQKMSNMLSNRPSSKLMGV